MLCVRDLTALLRGKLYLLMLFVLGILYVCFGNYMLCLISKDKPKWRELKFIQVKRNR